MAQSTPIVGRNHLLELLPERSASSLYAHASPMSFAPNDVLDASAIVLPTSGVLSLRDGAAGESGIEVAMIGSEGLVGWHVLQGCAAPPFRAVAMVPGRALRLDAAALAREPALQRELAALAAPYVQTITVQISHCALAAARRTVMERLARWLLMCFDRLDGDEVALTHEGLSAALGVRRPGVTVATHELEGIHAIRARRGMIRLLDRAILENVVRGCYGAPEREYAQLFARQVSDGPNPRAFVKPNGAGVVTSDYAAL